MTAAPPTPCPPAVRALGFAALGAGALSLLWLVFGRQGVFLNVLAATFGSADAGLSLHGLTAGATGRVFLQVLTVLLQFALALILLAAAASLLLRRPAARWAALFYCVASIGVEGVCTLLQISVLTPSGVPVNVLPILMSGLLTLFAIVLWGGLFLPDVAAAWQPHTPPAAQAPQGADH